MEYVSGISLKDIFLDKGNWWKLFITYRALIRIPIIINVLKLTICKTPFLGNHRYICPQCNHSIEVPHTCKSRFCSSCGKKATDNWIENSYNKLPKTTWQHITYTMPDKLWLFFWQNRHLMGIIPCIAANTIKKIANNKDCIPGIFIAVHTFGRDLKRNIHIHLSTTKGGLSKDHNSWRKNIYFYHDSLKKMWRYEIINLLRKEFKANRLKLPNNLKDIKSYKDFNVWTAMHLKRDNLLVT